MVKLIINGRFPSLNEYVNACRRNHYQANNLIQKAEHKIMAQLPKTYRFKPPIVISYDFYEPNRRRDLDNVSGMFHKIFQDAMVKSGMLEDDGWNYITGFRDDFHIDSKNPRVEINIFCKGEKHDKD